MAGILDGLNKAFSKLQNLGKRSADAAKGALDKTDIDEKIVEAAKGIKNKAQDVLDKTDIDEKITDAAKGLYEKGKQTVDSAAEAIAKAREPAPKDAMDELKDEVDAQYQQIRAAATSTDSIHDFIQNKYHAEEAVPEAPEAPAAPDVDVIHDFIQNKYHADEAAPEAPAEPEAPVAPEPPAAPEGIQDFVAQARAVAEKANDAAEKVQSAIGDTLQNISERALSTYDKVMEEAARPIEVPDMSAFAGTVADIASEVKSGIDPDAVSDAVASTVEEAAGTASDAVEAVGEEIVETVTDTVEEVAESAEEVVTDAAEAAQEAVSDAVEEVAPDALSDLFDPDVPAAPSPEDPFKA